jgi:hypothetical protein
MDNQRQCADAKGRTRDEDGERTHGKSPLCEAARMMRMPVPTQRNPSGEVACE